MVFAPFLAITHFLLFWHINFGGAVGLGLVGAGVTFAVGLGVDGGLGPGGLGPGGLGPGGLGGGPGGAGGGITGNGKGIGLLAGTGGIVQSGLSSLFGVGLGNGGFFIKLEKAFHVFL